MRPDPTSQNVHDEGIGLARELLSLLHQQRSAITEGRLDTVAALDERRDALLARLDGILPPGRVAQGELRELFARIDDEGRKTLALLESLRDELGQQLAADGQQREAAARYTRASQL